MKIDLKIKNAFLIDIVNAFTSISLLTLTKIFTGIIVLKITAIIIGPSGVALLSQLNNFSSVIILFANGGILLGVTKYISENVNNYSRIKSLISTAFRITVLCSIVTSVVLLIFHNVLSRYILHSEEYWYVFIVFGCCLILYALNNLLMNILNGYRDMKQYVLISIVGNILSLIFTLGLLCFKQLNGAMISVVTSQSVIFFITIYLLRKQTWFSWINFKNDICLRDCHLYFKYTIMTLFPIILSSTAPIIIRNFITSNISIVEAGYWDAMNRISSVYLSLFISFFSIYYLPKFSVVNKTYMRHEFVSYCKLFVPVIIFVFMIIYFLRITIIRLLLSSDFIFIEKMFIWQLLGDFFRIIGFFMVYLALAKAKMYLFVIMDLVFSFILIVLSCYFVFYYKSIIGVSQAYLLTYMLHCFCFIFVFRKMLVLKNDI